jgi:hypothetical protein
LLLILGPAAVAIAQGSGAGGQGAQEQEAPAWANKLLTDVASIKNDLGTLKKRVEEVEAKLGTAGGNPPAEQANPPTLEARVQALEGAVATLEQEVDKIGDTLNEISTLDPSSGKRYPRVLANMSEHAAFRGEMNQVAEQTQGKLVFHNANWFEPIVYVNGVAWRVRNDGRSHVPVTRSTVTVQRPFQPPLRLDFQPGNNELVVMVTPSGQLVVPVAP